jgi:hypothetical protein
MHIAHYHEVHILEEPNKLAQALTDNPSSVAVAHSPDSDRQQARPGHSNHADP